MILAKTVKGFGMGEAGEGQNITHQKKKLDDDDLKIFRDRFHVPISDEDLAALKYYKPAEDSEEMRYLKERRAKLGGSLPARRTKAEPLQVPDLEFFKSQLEGSGDREFSTTMAFVRILTALVRDKNIGPRIVPIVPDEARTFGMEGMFRQVGIYSSLGQLYTPQDSDQLSYYKEDKKGQILEEGINEGGSYCSWIAAATSYANHGVQMIPFYIYYSMFGFQRIGDFAWAGGDSRARGFLLGGTAGRTTLAGEGLQHQDGHSQLVATTIPNCRAYDPCFNYELAVIIQDGLRRMCVDQESVFYYITVMNENYAHPAMPEGAQDGILRGMYRLKARRQRQGARAAAWARARSCAKCSPRPSCSRSASRFRPTSGASRASASCAATRSTWSAGTRAIPRRSRARAYVASCFADASGPFVAATDYMKLVSDQIRQWVPGRYVVLGTDGFGRSDGREALRHHFEVDRKSVVVAALKALADEGSIDRSTVDEGHDRSRRRSRQAESRHRVSFYEVFTVEVVVPDLGDFADVEVIEVLVKPGDSRRRGAGAHHARDRQGHDGHSVAGRGQDHGAQGQDRRPRVGRQRDRDARDAADSGAAAQPPSTRGPRTTARCGSRRSRAAAASRRGERSRGRGRSGSRRLRRRRDHRHSREARRRRRGRAGARDARDREGEHGRAGAGSRPRARAESRGRRQGLGGRPAARAAAERRCGSRAPPAAAAGAG